MSRVDAEAIEENYQKTLDLLMDSIRPTVQIAFNDMLLTGRGGIIFDGKGVRAIQPDEWEPTPTPNADGEK